MVIYKVLIIFHIKCICKSWIPKFHNGPGKFPDFIKCPKCLSNWTVQQLLEPPINAKIEEKIFDTEKLYKIILNNAIEKIHMTKDKANEYCMITIPKQQKQFEEKYSIPIQVQRKLM